MGENHRRGLIRRNQAHNPSVRKCCPRPARDSAASECHRRSCRSEDVEPAPPVAASPPRRSADRKTCSGLMFHRAIESLCCHSDSACRTAVSSTAALPSKLAPSATATVRPVDDSRVFVFPATAGCPVDHFRPGRAAASAKPAGDRFVAWSSPSSAEPRRNLCTAVMHFAAQSFAALVLWIVAWGWSSAVPVRPNAAPGQRIEGRARMPAGCSVAPRSVWERRFARSVDSELPGWTALWVDCGPPASKQADSPAWRFGPVFSVPID